MGCLFASMIYRFAVAEGSSTCRSNCTNSSCFSRPLTGEIILMSGSSSICSLQLSYLARVTKTTSSKFCQISCKNVEPTSCCVSPNLRSLPTARWLLRLITSLSFISRSDRSTFNLRKHLFSCSILFYKICLRLVSRSWLKLETRQKSNFRFIDLYIVEDYGADVSACRLPRNSEFKPSKRHLH